LTWTNYDAAHSTDPEGAIYVFNGEDIGRGSEGFQSVLKRLGDLPRGSMLLIYPEETVLKFYAGTGLAWLEPTSSPFVQSARLHSDLKSLANEKGITIHYLGGPAGKYLIGKSGERGDAYLIGN
jgi:hypothetical protein